MIIRKKTVFWCVILSDRCRLLPAFNHAIRRRQDVFIQRDGADAVCHDASRCGVFDVRDGAADVGLKRAVFEGTVTCRVEGTVSPAPGRVRSTEAVRRKCGNSPGAGSSNATPGTRHSVRSRR